MYKEFYYRYCHTNKSNIHSHYLRKIHLIWRLFNLRKFRDVIFMNNAIDNVLSQNCIVEIERILIGFHTGYLDGL